jgi:anoctamin-1
MAARFIFVVLFENVVVFVMIFVRWTIPDQAASLRDQIRREAYITNEIVIKQEAERAAFNKSSARESNRKMSQNNWNMLLSNKLSGSQLDLLIHESEKFHKRDKVKNATENFIRSEMEGHSSGKREGDEFDLETKV